MSEEKKSNKNRGGDKRNISASNNESVSRSNGLVDEKDSNEHPSGLTFQQYRDMFLKHSDANNIKKPKFGANGVDYLRKL